MTKYTGVRFNREQLVFMTEVLYAGAVDKIYGSLPGGGIDIEEFLAREREIRDYLHGVINAVGIQLPILCYQLTGNGTPTNNFAGFGEFEKMVDDHIAKQANKDTIDENGVFPPIRHLAEQFVDGHFAAYLAE